MILILKGDSPQAEVVLIGKITSLFYVNLFTHSTIFLMCCFLGGYKFEEDRVSDFMEIRAESTKTSN